MQKMKLRKRVGAFALALMLCACLPFAASATEVEDSAPALFLSTVERLERSERPEATTRARYIEILYQAAGSPDVVGTISFSDVAPEAGYATALVWAEDRGIAHGDHRGAFRPDDYVTQAERSEFLTAALGALSETAQDVAAGVLAAYTGRVKTAEEWAICPARLEEVLSRMEQRELAAIVAPAQSCGTPPPLPS